MAKVVQILKRQIEWLPLQQMAQRKLHWRRCRRCRCKWLLPIFWNFNSSSLKVDSLHYWTPSDSDMACLTPVENQRLLAPSILRRKFIPWVRSSASQTWAWTIDLFHIVNYCVCKNLPLILFLWYTINKSVSFFL
jgi:hypothetical protein